MDDTLTIRIAELTLRAVCEPKHRLHLSSAASRFRVGDEATADFLLRVRPADLSLFQATGTLLFDSGKLWKLYDNRGEWEFVLTSEAIGPHPYRLARIDSGLTSANLLIHSAHESDGQTLYPFEYPVDEWLVIHMLSRGRGMEIHACGLVDDRGLGHLFVGQSGAGKSTMARLWDATPGVHHLSDDRIVLRKKEGRYYMHGTPWHGDAQHASPHQSPLSYLYFLTQGPTNAIAPLSPSEAVARLFAASFPPFHSPSALDFSLAFFSDLVSSVPCRELTFLPNPGVVELLRKAPSEARAT
jgi:hypothetical protein